MSQTARRLGAQDMIFLYAESQNTMMHVAGLMQFMPPPEAPADFLRHLVEDSRASDVMPPWNRKLSNPQMLYSPTQSWVVDEAFDLDYHVRRSALASPGDERELGVLVSRLHSHALDFTRPPWELHFIEGLEGGRFAIYLKMHHALIDGYTGQRMLARSMSTDPNDTEHPLFFNCAGPEATDAGTAQAGRGGIAGSVLGGLDGVAGALGDALSGVGGAISSLAGAGRSTAALTKALVNTHVRSDNEYAHLIGSWQAPHSILNARIGRNRRFATQQYKLDRLKAIGTAHDATLNDVSLAIIGGGLRRFLDEVGELPQKSLIAMVPVNVRPKGDAGGGNAVGAILAPLGTDIADPIERLHAIVTATRIAKDQLKTMNQEAIQAYTAALIAPAGVQLASTLSGLKLPWPYTFNVTVSNVPGPREALYLRGSRMEASYPVSIPAHSQALNVTVQSYADTMNFGFIGCRDTVPRLQRLAVYTGEALDEAEAASRLSRHHSQPR